MSDPKSKPNSGYGAADPSSAIRPLALPDIIDGRYRVTGRVGAGTMGVVLRAEDLFLERPVAIKLVEPSADPGVAERFVKEARAIAQIRHENVVQVYAFGPFQLSSFLAMELVVGESLEELIDAHVRAGETVPLPRAIAILRAIGEGLQAVHARRLVHRDVKPGNVIIEKDTDRPVLIDFGLARRRSKSSPRMSITGGTPSYMAPEQMRDPEGTRVTARTDIYAFACTAFELFSGRSLFGGSDIYSVLLAHMTEAPPRISSLRPELAPIDEVLLRALAKAPEDRYASVVEMVAALDAGLARVRSPSGRAGRALVLVADPSMRRSLVRNTAGALRTHGRDVACEAAESAVEAKALLDRHSYDLLVADEESAAGRLVELVDRARDRRPGVELVVLSRDLPATMRMLGEAHRTRHLVPKPVNAHVLAAVLGRLDLVKQSGRG